MIVSSFPFGSRVYGTPREDSDFDICVRCAREDATTIFRFQIPKAKDGTEYELDAKSHHVKVGEVDYILCFTDARFESFREGTERLKKIKPVSRETAKALFIENFKKEPA